MIKTRVVQARVNRYRKSTIGALVGASTAGGWLIVDLLLPDPAGDYLLFVLMGAVNAGVGWQVSRMAEKRNEQKTQVVKRIGAEGADF